MYLFYLLGWDCFCSQEFWRKDRTVASIRSETGPGHSLCTGPFKVDNTITVVKLFHLLLFLTSFDLAVKIEMFWIFINENVFQGTVRNGFHTQECLFFDSELECVTVNKFSISTNMKITPYLIWKEKYQVLCQCFGTCFRLVSLIDCV